MLNFIIELFNQTRNQTSPLRPPGAVEETAFQQLCIRCRKCELVCPYKTIKAGSIELGAKIGTPVIYAREIPCYLCMKCPEVCPTGALKPLEKTEVKMGIAVIDPELCLPFIGIICRACYERCPIYREAITLRDAIYPEVQVDKCVGCGICEHVCPAETPAIKVIGRKI